MKLKLTKALLLSAALAVPSASTVAFAQTGPAPAMGGLKAGVARIDITPQASDLPAAFKTIHDPLYVRALILDNGQTRAAIVVGDLPTIAPAELAKLTKDIAAEIHAPEANVLVAVSHDHSGVRIDHTVAGILLPGSPAISDMTMARTLQAVKQAMGAMQPAKAGYAQGTTALLGRRAGGGNPNDNSPPDPTLTVFEVETLAGDPIAFLVNAGLEPVMVAPLSGEISSDVSGAMERYLEQRFGDKAVVMYTVSSITNAVYSARRQGSAPAPDTHTVINAVGTLLGEDVLTTAARIKASPNLSISGVLAEIMCPGKVTTPLNTPAQCSDAAGSKLPKCVFTDHDAPPVRLQMGVLKLGDLTITQSDANITQPVWQALKAKAPANTILVAKVYGPMKYVVEDAAYATNSYNVTAATVKKGCAAGGFVTSSLSMIGQLH